MADDANETPNNGQADAIARRGVTLANQTRPAAEQSEFGGAKPLMSNDAEEKLFRPGE